MLHHQQDGVRYVTIKRISLRTTRESCAETHNNEKGVAFAPKLCKSFAQRPLTETHAFKGFFQTPKPARPGSAWKSKIVKTCELYQIFRCPNHFGHSLPLFYRRRTGKSRWARGRGVAAKYPVVPAIACASGLHERSARNHSKSGIILQNRTSSTHR